MGKRQGRRNLKMTLTKIRSLASTALAAAALVAAAPVPAQDVAPDQLVKTVTLEVVDLIAQDKELRSGNRANLAQLLDAKVPPHFNLHSTPALALRRSATEAS